MRLFVAMVAAHFLVGCGRIAFDPTKDGDTSNLAITPATSRTNLNTTTMFVATGGEPPYSFRIAQGPGEIDGTLGRFMAPSVPGTSTVEVVDSNGEMRTAEVSYGGDELFFVGGHVNNNAIDEIRRTTDGTQWDVVGHLPEARGDGSLLVFENKLWFLGGTLVTDTTPFDEVWTSPDGIEWTLTGQLPVAGATHAAAVYRGRIWIAGGQIAGDNYVTDVWSPADGVSWQIEPGLPRGLHGAELLVYADDLWLIAGHEQAGQTASVRRRTGTGSWPLIGNVPDAGEYHAAITRNGKMWVAGGLGLGDRVVTSSDGIAWTDVATLPMSRTHARTVAFRDEVWVVGGIPTQTIHSVDGTTWSMAAPIPIAIEGGDAAAFTPL
jgi:N-acetylneuraminic acid mutarotase